MSFNEVYLDITCPGRQKIPEIDKSAELLQISYNINILEKTARQHLNTDDKVKLQQLFLKTKIEIKDLKAVLVKDKSLVGQKLASDLKKLLVKFKNVSETVEDALRKQNAVKEIQLMENEDEGAFGSFMENPQDKQSLLESHQLNAEIDYNETLIEEREQDIQQISQDIFEINGLFTSLHGIVQEQGIQIDNIEANMESIAVNAESAGEELVVASKTQKKTRNLMCWILLILVLIVTLISLIIALT